jgi:hypothetical protein
MIHHVKRMKDINHMVISIDAEKASNRIQHPFTIKSAEKLRYARNLLDIIKTIYNKPTANIILNKS